GARAEAREASRWTLQEWLAQRDRNRMMDLWLSMNSPSPFEFMVGISHLSTKYDTVPATTESSNVSLAGELHAYAQFVGLTLEHENNTKAGVSDLGGILNIRLLGNSLQNSSLTLHGGQLIRKTDAEELKHLFAQASLQMYFTKYFGVDASYRAVQPTRSDVQNADVSGALTKAGLFIDFKSVRVFGSWYQDISTAKDLTTGDKTDLRRIGIQSGLRIYY
ncbi:MAG TPA: hypothetical protein PL182_03535, partial [Pseudobdellovibrionaceae bacterium]|nr:hypothetical protein [Pseudobdellovibrionaceae bacterium]